MGIKYSAHAHLPSPTPSRPWAWVKKVKIQHIENMFMLHMKLNGITKAATCKYFGCRSPRPSDPVVKSQLVQNMVVLHIKLKGITNEATLY